MCRDESKPVVYPGKLTSLSVPISSVDWSARGPGDIQPAVLAVAVHVAGDPSRSPDTPSAARFGPLLATVICAPVKPPLGVTVIGEVPLLPAATVTAAPLTVNEPVPPPIVPVKEKFKTLLPPKATGFGSKAPKELTIM